jgi:hypothetical protein
MTKSEEVMRSSEDERSHHFNIINEADMSCSSNEVVQVSK